MLVENHRGGYAYIPGLSFASAGVVSLPGISLVRAQFAKPQPLRAGFAAVERHLTSVNRPLGALCGFDLRIPQILSVKSFQSFNARYLNQLRAWDLLEDGPPALSRTNVVPIGTELTDDAVYAFSYSIEDREETKTFVVSGTAEVTPRDGSAGFSIFRRGENTAEALRDKTRCAVSNVRRVLDALGVSWDATCSVHLYSRWSLERDLRRAIDIELGSVTSDQDITCHDTNPPIFNLELEVDVRRYRYELILA
jgi:hypothetical protein